MYETTLWASDFTILGKNKNESCEIHMKGPKFEFSNFNTSPAEKNH